MKSAEVLLVLAIVVISVCDALNAGNKPTNGEENSFSEAVLEDTTVTKDPLEDATTKNVPDEDDSTVTNAPLDGSSNETVTTVKSVTSAPSLTQNVTSAPILNHNVTTAPSVNQTSAPSDGKKRLSTEVDKSKCDSLGIEIPNAAGCKCYKQKSAGTDTPKGFCYYYECAGNPTTLSKHKCEWIKE